MMKTTILLFAAALFASAQIEGPRLGLLVDGRQLHTAWGVPGVAVATALREVSAKFVAASPKQDYLLAVPADGPGILVLTPDGREDGDRLVLPGVDGVDAIVFSVRGTSVAIRRGSRVDLISGLPQRAEIAQTFDLSFAGQDVAALSVSDDGSSIVAVFPAGAYRMDASGMSRVPVDGILAAAFLPKSRDLAVASEDKITILREGQSAAEFAVPGQSAKSLFTTARFVVAFDRDFLILDLATGQSTRLGAAKGNSDDEPRSVQASGDVLFYLSNDGWGAVDLTEQEPRLIRIPKRFTPEAATEVAQ